MNPVDEVTFADTMRQLAAEAEPKIVSQKHDELIAEIKRLAAQGKTKYYTEELILLPESIVYKIMDKLGEKGFKISWARANPTVLIIDWS